MGNAGSFILIFCQTASYHCVYSYWHLGLLHLDDSESVTYRFQDQLFDVLPGSYQVFALLLPSPLLESGSLFWQVCFVPLHQSRDSVRVEPDQTAFHLPTSESGARPLQQLWCDARPWFQTLHLHRQKQKQQHGPIVSIPGQTVFEV